MPSSIPPRLTEPDTPQAVVYAGATSIRGVRALQRWVYFAIAKGLPIVTVDWIVESVEEGELQRKSHDIMFESLLGYALKHWYQP